MDNEKHIEEEQIPYYANIYDEEDPGKWKYWGKFLTFITILSEGTIQDTNSNNLLTALNTSDILDELDISERDIIERISNIYDMDSDMKNSFVRLSLRDLGLERDIIISNIGGAVHTHMGTREEMDARGQQLERENISEHSRV